jgi:hypothetical protein
MKRTNVKAIVLAAITAFHATGCSTNAELSSSGNSTLTDVAQTSSQLASGASFIISGSSSDSIANGNRGPHHKGPGGHGGPHDLIDGTSLLAPTDELLAIVDAESAGDFRGLRMHANGGATVTNYDASGNTVSLPQPAQNSGGPEGCSFSGKQFPQFDSLLAKVAKTVIDFGSGVTQNHGSASITRSGKITITRTGSSASRTETITFENYKVNGASIVGVKTRISTFDSSSGSGSSTTNVVNGKITFSDGTVSTWVSTKKRASAIILDSNNHPSSGQVVTEGSSSVTATDGTVIYSHTITSPVIENIACRRHTPVSGVVSTVYRTDSVSVDFGNGDCDSTTVSVTLNGVATTKELGGR